MPPRPMDAAKLWAKENLENVEAAKLWKHEMCGWSSAGTANKQLGEEYGGHKWRTLSIAVKQLWPSVVKIRGRRRQPVSRQRQLLRSAEWTARISDPNPASQHENGPRVLFQDPGVLCMCIGHSLFEYKHRSLKHYSHPPATQTGGLNHYQN